MIQPERERHSADGSRYLERLPSGVYEVAFDGFRFRRPTRQGARDLIRELKSDPGLAAARAVMED